MKLSSLARGIATLHLSLLFALGSSQSAGAHARIERADPAPDTVLSAPPADVRIWMTQEMMLRTSTMIVTDANGTRVDNGDGQVDQLDPERKQLVATLGAIGAGTYIVTYTTLSAEDGDEFTESYAFSVASGDARSSLD
jgi:methionine-rich copper-binding protein CopC